MAQDLSQFPKVLFTQAQVRQAELSAVSQGASSLYELVERAGAAAFECLTKHNPNASSVFILAGSGNNGADALVWRPSSPCKWYGRFSDDDVSGRHA